MSTQKTLREWGHLVGVFSQMSADPQRCNTSLARCCSYKSDYKTQAIQLAPYCTKLTGARLSIMHAMHQVLMLGLPCNHHSCIPRLCGPGCAVCIGPVLHSVYNTQQQVSLVLIRRSVYELWKVTVDQVIGIHVLQHSA